MAKTYNPKRFIVAFGGVPLTGMADGTFITIEQRADQFALVVGADGEGARSASADQSATITLTLLQTSASNDYLSTMLRIDRLSNAGAAVFSVQDLNGTTVAVANQAWIMKAANIENGKEVTSREWTFETDSMEINVGGNI